MHLIAHRGSGDRRLTVVAYDVAQPRRAYRTRRLLQAWRIDGQYSVVETWLTARERIELCADLRECLSIESDRLLVAMPYSGIREALEPGGWSYGSRESADAAATLRAVEQHAGNAILAYDVRDRERLIAVQGSVAETTIALLRSVYWFRGAWRDARTVAERAAQAADLAADRIWLYPLASAADLWFVVGPVPPVLPVRRGGWPPALQGRKGPAWAE